MNLPAIHVEALDANTIPRWCKSKTSETKSRHSALFDVGRINGGKLQELSKSRVAT